MKFEKVSAPEYLKGVLGDKTEDLGLSITAKENYALIKLPVRKTKHSAGYDFHSPIKFILKPGESINIPTGIKAKLDPNVVLQLYPRSKYGFGFRLQLDNTVGIVDADYYNNVDNEGHIFIKVTNDGKTGKALTVRQGDAFAQGILIPFLTMEDDNVTKTRVGGIGSTSKEVDTKTAEPKVTKTKAATTTTKTKVVATPSKTKVDSTLKTTVNKKTNTKKEV